MWDGGDLLIQVIQDEAKVRVWNDKKVVSGAYVKVFVREYDQTRFWRDGYTDIAGIFSYTGQNMKNIEKIAILVVT